LFFISKYYADRENGLEMDVSCFPAPGSSPALADPPRTPPLLANGSFVGTRRLVVPDKRDSLVFMGIFMVVARLKVFSWKLQ